MTTLADVDAFVCDRLAAIEEISTRTLGPMLTDGSGRRVSESPPTFAEMMAAERETKALYDQIIGKMTSYAVDQSLAAFPQHRSSTVFDGRGLRVYIIVHPDSGYGILTESNRAASENQSPLESMTIQLYD